MNGWMIELTIKPKKLSEPRNGWMNKQVKTWIDGWMVNFPFGIHGRKKLPKLIRLPRACPIS